MIWPTLRAIGIPYLARKEGHPLHTERKRKQVTIGLSEDWLPSAVSLTYTEELKGRSEG